MISFKNFLTQYTKKFVCLYFDDETNAALREYAKKNGFNLNIGYSGQAQTEEDFDFHITVYYTSNQVKSPELKDTIEPFTVTPSKLELLGDEKNIPVIKLKLDKNLKNIRDWFTEQGFRDRWPNYKPHISISYDKKNYDISSIPLPDFPLTVTSLTVQNQ